MMLYFIYFLVLIILINYWFILIYLGLILNYSSLISLELEDWEDLFFLYSYKNEHFFIRNTLLYDFFALNNNNHLQSIEVSNLIDIFYLGVILIVQFFFGIIPFYR